MKTPKVGQYPEPHKHAHTAAACVTSSHADGPHFQQDLKTQTLAHLDPRAIAIHPTVPAVQYGPLNFMQAPGVCGDSNQVVHLCLMTIKRLTYTETAAADL